MRLRRSLFVERLALHQASDPLAWDGVHYLGWAWGRTRDGEPIRIHHGYLLGCAEARRKEALCRPGCYRHGTGNTPRLFHHEPWDGFPSLVALWVEGMCCPGHGWRAELPSETYRHWKMTRALVRLLAMDVVTEPSPRIPAERYGVPVSKVREFAGALRWELDVAPAPLRGYTISFDDVHLRRHRTCTSVLDPATGRFIGVLKGAPKAVVGKWLRDKFLPGRRKITVVIDGDTKVRQVIVDVCAEMKVKLTLIIDAFHVIKNLNKRLIAFARECYTRVSKSPPAGLDRLLCKHPERLRKIGKWPQIEAIFAAFPPIGEFYWLREDFCAIYGLLKRGKARRALDAWLKRRPSDRVDAALDSFRTWIGHTWREEYLMFFGGRHTNGRTEASHRLIKGWSAISGLGITSLSILMQGRHPGRARRVEAKLWTQAAAHRVACRPRLSAVRRQLHRKYGGTTNAVSGN